MQHGQWLGLELEQQQAGQEHGLNREGSLKMNGWLFGVKSCMNTRCTGYTTVDITVSPCQVPTVGRTVESERKAQRWERMCGYGERMDPLCLKQRAGEFGRKGWDGPGKQVGHRLKTPECH